jgi:hypothetical protein
VKKIFGLWLMIEVTWLKPPVMVRDIFVFRKFAGVNAFYFVKKPEHSENTIQGWQINGRIKSLVLVILSCWPRLKTHRDDY